MRCRRTAILLFFALATGMLCAVAASLPRAHAQGAPSPTGASLVPVAPAAPEIRAAPPGGTLAALFDRLTADGLPRDYLARVFADPAVVYSPQAMARKMNALIVQKVSPQKATEGARNIYAGYLDPALVAEAHRFLDERREILAESERRYGVPKEVTVAVMLVETKMGRVTGRDKILVTLVNMAGATEFSDVEPYLPMDELSPELRDWARRRMADKAEWAYRELSALLRFTLKARIDPLSIAGSPYGAFGLGQFMPSSALAYGVDGDGDEVVDLFNEADALHSVANFLRKNGWRGDMNEARQRRVVFRYNHSETYAETVLQVSRLIRDLEEARAGR